MQCVCLDQDTVSLWQAQGSMLLRHSLRLDGDQSMVTSRLDS